jgi:alkylation response protein AidB-like acyl-CoA dehydrogenase
MTAAQEAMIDRAIASTHRLTDDGAGFATMLNVVPPQFNLGSACVALGLCHAAVAAATTHLKIAKFEHLGQSLGEALPTLRALLAGMVIKTDGLVARIDDLVGHLERPRETTMLRVRETKAAGETAISVTSAKMRAAGGAAFSRHTSIERLFRLPAMPRFGKHATRRDCSQVRHADANQA